MAGIHLDIAGGTGGTSEPSSTSTKDTAADAMTIRGMSLKMS